MEEEKKAPNVGGRPRKFETPEILRDAFIEFFEHCDNNPWKKADFIRSGEMAGTIVYLPTARPYTIAGFQAYFDLGHNYLEQLDKATAPKETGNDGDFEPSNTLTFSGVLSWAKNKCYSQKFEGAAVGAFNANIIARDLGLVDKGDTKHSGNIQHTITGMEIL